MEALTPIPNPQPNDDEDVSWALSTAGALWARGERSEALKWLRRAAEQASDVNDDVRALTLFKAAAEVAQQASSITPPPASASVAPPPTTSASPPPSASVAPPTSVSPPPVMSSAPPAGSVPPPPRRKAPPSLPPRNAPAAAPPPAAPLPAAPRAASGSTVPASPPLPASLQSSAPARTAPPSAPARRSPSTGAPSPLTKPSRSQSPFPAPQVSPAARSMPVSPGAGAPMPARRPEATVTRTPLPSRAASPAPSAPTRPVASRPAATTPAPSSTATARPPLGRGARVFDEITSLQPAQGGHGFDDLDENTQVLQAMPAMMARKGTAQEIDESFDSILSDEAAPPDSEPADEPTDPGLHARAHDDVPPEDATGPMSAPATSSMWTAPDRSALFAGPDTLGTETTARRFAPLLAHRVAVMASRTPGQISVVPIDAASPAPPGAAIAMLVPLSSADDDVIAQLFGSLE